MTFQIIDLQFLKYWKNVYRRTYKCIQQILNTHQYGFREKHSAINAVIAHIKALEEKDSVIIIFLALNEAFDTIDHQILLHIHNNYGIRGTPLR